MMGGARFQRAPSRILREGLPLMSSSISSRKSANHFILHPSHTTTSLSHMKSQLNYWIHGKKASGKSVLASHIIGPEGTVISARASHLSVMHSIMAGKRVVLDEFCERKPSVFSLLYAVLNGGPIANIKSFKPDLDVLVVISEHPPKDPTLIRRFHVIEITAGFHRHHRTAARTTPANPL